MQSNLNLRVGVKLSSILYTMMTVNLSIAVCSRALAFPSAVEFVFHIAAKAHSRSLHWYAGKLQSACSLH
jgi:hypothetical protein